MRSKQTPSPTALVVKPGAEPSAEVVDRLASLGTVRPIPGTERVVLEVAGAAGSARELWRRVLDAVDRIRWAAPVVVDETGATHLPTGEVSVRFRRAPSAGELKRFASAHRVRVRKRNEFVREQVTVGPLDERECYLPELVEEISAEDGVLAAWADTMSEFRR